MGFYLNNCPTHKGGVYFLPHTHKIETKRIIKTKNPPKILEKPKEGEKTSKEKKKKIQNLQKKKKT
jgi:hypothetical protein